MNRFRFLNVGQGLFYTGKLDCNFNFVFDCGSESNNSQYYLKKAIENEYVLGDTVNLFIVSHLHMDHINGLEELRKRVNIDHVHLPYLGMDPIFIQCYLGLASMDARGRLDKRTYNILHDFYLNEDNTVKNEYYKPNGDFYWKMDDSERKDDYLTTYCVVKETIRLDNGWELLFFNRFITNDLEQRIVIQLKSCLGGGDFVEYANKFGLLRIQDIFKRSLNDREDIDKFATVVLHRPGGDYNNMTLLTGDIVMDEGLVADIKKASLNKLISYFQLPHHGSKENFDAMGDLKNRGINYFISFGLGNAYKHPASLVLNELVENKKSCGLSYQFSTPYFYWNEYYI